MLTRREAQIVGTVLAPFADCIEKVAVFGSRAMGTARPASDIDLALFGTLSEEQVARMWTLFDESALAVTVDLADYTRIAHAPLKRHIDGAAKTLFTQEQLRALP